MVFINFVPYVQCTVWHAAITAVYNNDYILTFGSLNLRTENSLTQHENFINQKEKQPINQKEKEPNRLKPTQTYSNQDARFGYNEWPNDVDHAYMYTYTYIVLWFTCKMMPWKVLSSLSDAIVATIIRWIEKFGCSEKELIERSKNRWVVVLIHIRRHTLIRTSAKFGNF